MNEQKAILLTRDDQDPSFDPPSFVKSKIFQRNYITTMAADALAACIARSSATMLMAVQVPFLNSSIF